MYSEIIFLVIALAVAKENCNCTNEQYEKAVKESSNIFHFLKMLEEKGLTNEQKFPDVNAGYISGSFDCDCSENLRKKEKIDLSSKVKVERGTLGGVLQSGRKRSIRAL